MKPAIEIAQRVWEAVEGETPCEPLAEDSGLQDAAAIITADREAVRLAIAERLEIVASSPLGNPETERVLRHEAERLRGEALATAPDQPPERRWSTETVRKWSYQHEGEALRMTDPVHGTREYTDAEIESELADIERAGR